MGFGNTYHSPPPAGLLPGKEPLVEVKDCYSFSSYEPSHPCCTGSTLSEQTNFHRLYPCGQCNYKKYQNEKKIKPIFSKFMFMFLTLVYIFLYFAKLSPSSSSSSIGAELALFSANPTTHTPTHPPTHPVQTYKNI